MCLFTALRILGSWYTGTNPMYAIDMLQLMLTQFSYPRPGHTATDQWD